MERTIGGAQVLEAPATPPAGRRLSVPCVKEKRNVTEKGVGWRSDDWQELMLFQALKVIRHKIPGQEV